MVKIFTASVVFFLLIFNAKAAIWTVSKNPGIHGMFSEITEAQADARVRPGDTLMVSRASAAYVTVTITKSLVILGEGYNSLKEQGNFLRPTINIMVLRASASGTVVMGFHFTNRIEVEQAGTNDIVIRNCRVNRGVWFQSHTVTNWLIEENVFESQISTIDGILRGLNANNVIIRNNVFGRDARISDFKNGTVNVSHNVFVSAAGDKRAALVNCENLLVTNNIFYRRSFPTTGLRGNVITNNIFFETGGTELLDNTSSGNIEADPQFIQFPGDANGDFAGNVIIKDWNFKVQPGSPAVGAATDGDNIGLMDFVILYGPPFLPYVSGLTILNPTLPNGSELSIQLKVKYPENN